LFEAQWLHRRAALAPPLARVGDVRWQSLSRAAELNDWETAWSGEAAVNGDAPSRIFLPSLLNDPNLSFIAAYRAQRIVAGAIANRAADAVGLSNLFVRDTDADRLRAACVAAVIDAFPRLPIVGYESGDDLESALALGFEPLCRLRIWTSANQSV